MLPLLKREATYLLKSAHNSWNHYFVSFWGSFAIGGSSATTAHLPHVRLKISNGRCLGYVVFECHANFHINWESFAHRDQQKNMLRVCCPWIAEVTDVEFWFMDRFHCKPIESTPIFKLIQKITNFVESKSFAWHNMADLNTNKSS